jgi:alcohol dehydrogenase class IV
MLESQFMTREQLSSLDKKRTWVITSGDRNRSVLEKMGFQVSGNETIPEEMKTILIAGGGKSLDKWKYKLRDLAASKHTLIAIPTIWGSGSEVSSICVIDRKDRKEIFMDQAYLPDRYSYLKEFSDSIPQHLAKNACGDVWAHALEGFISPLASDKLRQDFSVLIGELYLMTDFRDFRWFALSSQASYYQSQASVGLIHGMAHVLEPLIGQTNWGHARLCATLLYPVFKFNEMYSDKLALLATEFAVDLPYLFEKLQVFFDHEDYDFCLSFIRDNWKTILKDQCSRTNGVLVRPKHLSFFLEKGFL